MIKIYHNPRCSKSRESLTYLESTAKEFEIIKYIDNPLSTKELEEIIKLLNITPVELVRKNEKLWKENYKGKKLSDKKIVEILSKNPKLIERPIVIYNKKAEIGRPLERIITLLK